jgi:site-specific recombinase XerD
MYLTRIKAIMNSLIERGELHISKNPFGKGKYIIPKSRSAKRPLEHEEIMSIVNYQTEIESEVFARDMFVFSYVANGMNFYDIFKLKWSDIKGDAFYFIRQKTSVKLPDKQIRVFLNAKIQSIIDTHGSRKLGNNYIFNVVPWGATKDVEQRKIRSAISGVNMKLKKIASTLGITSDISTYFARHTFATMMHDLGASINTIKDVIGHEDIKSTQSYIGSENKERLMELQGRLLK